MRSGSREFAVLIPRCSNREFVVLIPRSSSNSR